MLRKCYKHRGDRGVMKKKIITITYAFIFAMLLTGGAIAVKAAELTDESTMAEITETAKPIKEDLNAAPATGSAIEAEALEETESIPEFDREEALEETEGDETSEDKAETKAKKKKKGKKKANYTEDELKLLACTIFVEAGNQSLKGKKAVGNIVINRVKSNLFPNSIKEVLYQKTTYGGRILYQFAIVKPNGTLPKAMAVYGKRIVEWEKKAEAECIKAAKAVLEGESVIDESLYYFRVYNAYIKATRPNGVKIGAHYFYK